MQRLSCHSWLPDIHSFVTSPATISHQRVILSEKSVFPEDIKLIIALWSGHLFQSFMRSFHSKRSLACHAVKGWVWGKTCVCMCMSAPDICIYLYICILFVQINVSSDVEYRRETLRRSWYNSKASEIFLSKTWNSDFWLIVKMIWRKIVAHQGAKVCIYLLMLLLYYSLLHK